MIRARTDEATYPADATILTFLNAGLEQIVAALGALRRFQVYPTSNGQNVITLCNDVQDILSASWSSGDPTQNSTVYRLKQYEPQQFMDFCAGFPAVGAGPPSAFMLISDQGTGPLGSLPAPQTPLVTALAGGLTTADTVTVQTTYVSQPSVSSATIQESLPSPSSPPLALAAGETVEVTSPPPYGNAIGYRVYLASAQQATSGAVYTGTYVPLGQSFTITAPWVFGGAAPVTSTASYPSGGSIAMQLYPPAMVGQLNTYFRARPRLWADTTASSFTNADTLVQEACILFGCMRVLENRGRGDEAAQIFAPQLGAQQPDGSWTGIMGTLLQQIQRRSTPKTGRVTDIMSLTYGTNMPWWI
jgi:hypothetical protein